MGKVSELVIKTCPFCGSAAQVWISDTRMSVFVECSSNECGCRTAGFDSISEAVKAWNRRVDAPDMKQKTEQYMMPIGKGCFNCMYGNGLYDYPCDWCENHDHWRQNV